MICFDYIGKPTAIVKPCNPTMTDALEIEPDSQPKLKMEEQDHIKTTEYQMSGSLHKDISNKQEISIEFEMDPFNKSVEDKIDDVIPTLKETNSEVLDLDKSQKINSSYVDNLRDIKGNIKFPTKIC